jgi:prepilin-type N-terminal cleavage/methylation domain-containing protein
MGECKVRRGFSLIEVMLAITIITLGIFPVMYLLSSGTRGVKVSVREVQAVNHAVTLLELLKGIPFSTLNSFCDSGELEAAQEGWMIYDRNTEKMIASEDEKGVWDVIGSEPGKEFFRTYLGPLGNGTDGPVLSELELYFYERSAIIICSDTGCTIKAKVMWKSEQGQRDRHVEFKSLVMESR